MKKLYAAARLSKMWQDGLRITTQKTTQIRASKIEQDLARCSKMRKRPRHNYASLRTNASQQDEEWSKNHDQNSQVEEVLNSTLTSLCLLFSSYGTAPPPYTMESETLSKYEWRRPDLVAFKFQKQNQESVR